MRHLVAIEHNVLENIAVSFEAKRTEKNRAVRSSVKTFLKKARTAAKVDVTAPETLEAATAAVKALDKAVQNGVIHKNQAARRKSRLILALNKLKAAK